MTHKRLTLFAGHYGSGKTNIALNYARWLRRKGEAVTVADLDIVNPYFRTKDSEEDLKKEGIGLIVSPFANSNLDVPAMPKETYALIAERGECGVLDIGGDDRGALALGRYVPEIRAEGDYEMLFVINRARPLTRTVADTILVLREIEAACGLPFELAPKYECEERYPPTLPAEEVPLYLARLKSNAYPHPLAPHEILLTADTVVVSEGAVLGKPRDRDDAAAMLRRLSGATHTVVSGVTLRTAERSRSFGARTDVRFRPLAGEEIAYYLDTFRPYDKAGSYGIQEWIGYAAIERIEGSFYNVMGLPVQKLYVELNEFLG